MRPAPLFGTVVVAGVGLIGGSVALGARQRFLADRVIGLDRDPEVLEVARFHGVVDEARVDPGPWLADADLVVLATPARLLVPLARELAPYLAPNAIVTDVGSVKRPIVDALSDLRFVGGHPMAGSDRAGVRNADAHLIENAVWVLTPTPSTDPGALERVRTFVTHLGARSLEVPPEQHDRLVATVSHLPYLSSLALTQVAHQDGERDLMMLLAAGGFRDLTRVASGSPVMSRDMVSSNAAAVRDALRRFRASLDRLEGMLDDPDALLAAAQEAKRARDAIPVVRRSLLPRRPEVVLAVPDVPGQLARITAACGEADVNIKEIEVLSIREAGGAVRLAFEDEETAARAEQALRTAGYEARGHGA
ncbi:MAG: prephenate dehydrogenase [Trueperaceae bacterium]|nr:prephenate dehydrogenase [Trueperaceae bacterium]